MKSQNSHLACTYIFRHLVILKDLSVFLVGSPQKDEAERIWMPCPEVWHLSREHISTTPPVQHRELCTSSLPCGHPASHMRWPSAKTRSLQSSHAKNTRIWGLFQGKLGGSIQDILKEGTETFFSLNFSFGAPWLQILQVHKERYVHMENLWFTGLRSVDLIIDPESRDL